MRRVPSVATHSNGDLPDLKDVKPCTASTRANRGIVYLAAAAALCRGVFVAHALRLRSEKELRESADHESHRVTNRSINATAICGKDYPNRI